MLVLDRNMFHRVSNHPVHMLEKEGTFSPSSFIPFCSFGDDMNIMGKKLNGFHDSVCDSFEAKIRNDELCYEVDLEKYRDESKIKEQLESGLVLVLDYNLERQSKMYNPKKVNSSENVHIYLDTISKYHLRI